jgi:hypothetical protein
VTDAKFGEDVLQMSGDRVFADEQGRGDLLVGSAFGRQAQYLHLSSCQSSRIGQLAGVDQLSQLVDIWPRAHLVEDLASGVGPILAL